MEKILRGKYLVRKSKLSDGQDVLTISGVFYPQNFNIDEVKDNDEMWVSDIIISSGGIRFTDPIGLDGGSPEDFISGNNQSPSCWNTKGVL
jgi:hypothetical protein